MVFSGLTATSELIQHMSTGHIRMRLRSSIVPLSAPIAAQNTPLSLV